MKSSQTSLAQTGAHVSTQSPQTVRSCTLFSEEKNEDKSQAAAPIVVLTRTHARTHPHQGGFLKMCASQKPLLHSGAYKQLLSRKSCWGRWKQVRTRDKGGVCCRRELHSWIQTVPCMRKAQPISCKCEIAPKLLSSRASTPPSW